MLVVVALGGNAILRPGQQGTIEEQENNIQLAAEQLAQLAASGAKLVVTHGNGPQVGNAMLRNEMASSVLPPLPMATCVAQTQGQIGTMIELALTREFQRQRVGLGVVTLLTHVVVDLDDPGFKQPSKPVGRFYPDLATARLTDRDPEAVWTQVPGTGWRRVVPSPVPLEIVEIEAFPLLLESCCIIAAGGGGVPVYRAPSGALRPVASVIDKDATAALLAAALGADALLILTAVPGVALDFGRPGQRFLKEVGVAELRHHLDEGQFGSGSMAPKVQAACDFVARTGGTCTIASLIEARAAFAGKAGTRVSPGAGRASWDIA